MIQNPLLSFYRSNSSMSIFAAGYLITSIKVVESDPAKKGVYSSSPVNNISLHELNWRI